MGFSTKLLNTTFYTTLLGLLGKCPHQKGVQWTIFVLSASDLPRSKDLALMAQPSPHPLPAFLHYDLDPD